MGARQHVEVAPQAAVDSALLVEADIQRAAVAEQGVAGQVADDALPEGVLALVHSLALVARQEHGHGNLHGLAGLASGGAGGVLAAVVPDDGGPALPGQDGLRLLRHTGLVHIPHADQDHVGGRIERLVAVVEGLGGDLPDALQGAHHRHAGRAVLIQPLHQVGVHPPIRIVLRLLDFLGNDALLPVHALLGEIGRGHKPQQDAEIFIEIGRGGKIIGGHGVAGEGVVRGPVPGEGLHDVFRGHVEHFVFQIMGDAGGGFPPPALRLEAQVHAAVTDGQKGVALGVEGLADRHDLQAVGKGLPENRFPQTGILRHFHAQPSFPFKK